jgi:hypothetical protein
MCEDRLSIDSSKEKLNVFSYANRNPLPTNRTKKLQTFIALKQNHYYLVLGREEKNSLTLEVVYLTAYAR